MFFHFILLVVSLVSFLRSFHVSSCDYNCADKPVFTPSSLVVKFGDPTSASCSVCQHACIGKQCGLEKSLGIKTTNGNMITWEVNSMTEWEASPECYYNADSDTYCCTLLPVTVYQPPHNVSISFNHNGPMIEGEQYTLQCSVYEVAPVENLNVTFYKGQTVLGQLQSNNTGIKPVTETFTFDITPSKEDDGVQYWCEAKLELGPEGPQRPPVVTSQNILATVHHKPRGTSYPHYQVILTEGELLGLDCSATGNPRPSYTWITPDGPSTFTGSVFTIRSVTRTAEGRYTCSIKNYLATITVEVNVVVIEPPHNVSISFNHNGPMIEGEQYTLQCSVYEVAPVENLIVTFYKGQTVLGQLQSNNTGIKPVNETFTFDITPSKEDDGVQYWCEAKLELGPEGSQRPPVVTSQNILATVHRKTTLPSPTSEPSSKAHSDTGRVLIHRFIMCFMLFFLL